MSTGADVKPIALALPRAGVADFVGLMKLRLVSLVLVTAGVGFYVASAGPHDLAFFLRLVQTVLGTALVAGGSMVLNQYMERDTDAMMLRTRTRPLPEGRVAPVEALIFGVALSVVGVVLLCLMVNLLTGGLGLLTSLTYLLLYTPLKTRTPACTLVGALSGAFPPMMGYTAAVGHITSEAWLLFAILFVWQIPHFLAIAWLYREDYARGRQMMLPVVDPSGASTSRHMLSFAMALLPVTLMPAVIRATGAIYFLTALLLGVLFLCFALSVAVRRTQAAARAMFIVSVVYLPLLLVLMMYDHR